jgi:translation initiation factor IF-2
VLGSVTLGSARGLLTPIVVVGGHERAAGGDGSHASPPGWWRPARVADLITAPRERVLRGGAASPRLPPVLPGGSNQPGPAERPNKGALCSGCGSQELTGPPPGPRPAPARPGPRDPPSRALTSAATPRGPRRAVTGGGARDVDARPRNPFGENAWGGRSTTQPCTQRAHAQRRPLICACCHAP